MKQKKSLSELTTDNFTTILRTAIQEVLQDEARGTLSDTEAAIKLPTATGTRLRTRLGKVKQ